MLLYLLKLRFRTLYRSIFEIGIIRLTVLCILCFCCILYLLTIGNIHLPVCTCAGLLIIIHSLRMDYLFLKLSFKRVYSIFLLEYSLLSIPFLIISMLRLDVYAILYPIIILLVPFLSLASLKTVKFCFPFLKIGSFEFQIGTRKRFFYLIASYLIAVLGIIFHAESIIYFAMFLGTIGIAEINILEENKQYLKNYSKVGHCIVSKCVCVLQNTTILFIPYLFSVLFFDFSTFKVVANIFAGTLFLGLSCKMLAIIFKDQHFPVVCLTFLVLIPLLGFCIFSPLIYILFTMVTTLSVFLAFEKTKYLLG